MRHDPLQLYRATPTGSPTDALRVVHRLGAVWYAGFRYALAPQPAPIGSPWCQFVLVPRAERDGVEDALVVADAELARHGLAWRLDAPENEGNVFVGLAHRLHLAARLAAGFGDGVSVALGARVHDPLTGRATLDVRTIAVDGRPLVGFAAGRALASVGLGT
jgi:hypothetical protein